MSELAKLTSYGSGFDWTDIPQFFNIQLRFQWKSCKQLATETWHFNYWIQTWQHYTVGKIVNQKNRKNQNDIANITSTFVYLVIFSDLVELWLASCYVTLITHDNTESIWFLVILPFCTFMQIPHFLTSSSCRRWTIGPLLWNSAVDKVWRSLR